jgi:hypothetical protein
LGVWIAGCMDVDAWLVSDDDGRGGRLFVCTSRTYDTIDSVCYKVPSTYDNAI